MKETAEIKRGEYTPITYRQFAPTPRLRRWMRIAGWLSLPFVYPFVLLARLAPETGFRTASEFLSLAPFAWGIILRYQFYRRTLRSCGENVFIGFGTVFYYPQINIGNNVLIGMYNTIHHCDFGNDVMTAEGCRFLSGSRYHHYGRTDIPMSRQGGELTRICLGNDIWIGANAIVMDEVADGCVVGGGSIVTKAVPPYQIIAGNPARLIRMREHSSSC